MRTDEKRSLSSAEQIELVRQLFRAMTPATCAAVPETLHEDYVFELPYFPTQNLAGRDNYIAALDLFFPTLTRLDLELVKFYECAAPDTLIAEYRSYGQFVDGRPPYANHYIGIFEFREGKITLWREFLNAIVMAKSFPDSTHVTQSLQNSGATAHLEKPA